MADERKVYEALFQISGKLDKNLIAAARDAKQLMKGLDLASGTTDRNVQKVLKDLGKIASTSGRLKHAATEFGNSWKAAGEKAHRALEPLHRMLHTLGHFTGLGAAVGAIGGTIEASALLRESLEEAKHRQNLSTTLETVLRSMHKEGELRSTLANIRQFTDYSPFTYGTGVQAFSGLASNLQAAGQLNAIGGLRGVSDILHNVSEVASGGQNPDETLKHVMMHVNAAVGGGRVREGMITQIGQDIGGSIMPFLVQAISSDKGALGPVKALADQLRQQSKLGDKGKERELQLLEGFLHKRNNFLDAKYLVDAFKVAATDPNSPFYHHLEAQADTFTGRETTFFDKLRDLKTGLGNIEIGALMPLLQRFNDFFDKDKINAYLDVAEKAQGAFGELDKSLSRTGVYSTIRAIGSDIGKIFGASGLGGIADAFKTVQDPVNGIRSVMTASGEAWKKQLDTFTTGIRNALEAVRQTVDYIQVHFQTILHGAEVAGAVYFGAKGLVGLANIVNAFKTLAGGIFNVGSAVINVATTGAGGAAVNEAKNGGLLPLLANPATAGLGLGVAAGLVSKMLVEKYHLDEIYSNIKPLSGTSEGLRTDDDPRSIANQKELAEQRANSAAIEALKAQQTASSISAGASSASQIQTSIAAAAAEARRLATSLAGLQGLGTPGGGPPAPHVEGHALGGLYRRRHLAMIGESGPELVLPLSNRVRTAGIMGSAGLGGITFAIAPAEVHIHGNADRATVQAAIDGAYRKVVNDIEHILDAANERRSFEAFA